VQFGSVSWLRAVSAYRTDNRLQIEQQTGPGSHTFGVLVTCTQRKAEGLICPGVQGWQVAEAVTGSAAVHSSYFVVHSCFSIFLDVYQ